MPVSAWSRPRVRWDSWSPGPVHIRSSTEHDEEIHDTDFSGIDENPLTYFLTPAPSNDQDVDLMDFDAGIEDAKRPPPIIRSVSPSSLDGLGRPLPRPPTPPKSPPSPELDTDLLTPDDDDDDDYISFAPHHHSHPLDIPVSLRDWTTTEAERRAKSRKDIQNADALLSPASFHISNISGRGRLLVRPGLRSLSGTQGSAGAGGRAHSMPTRLSPHSWREPSPDVWSIEEETEEALSEMDESVLEERREARAARATAIDIPAAKPRKRVRFVLPMKE